MTRSQQLAPSGRRVSRAPPSARPPMVLVVEGNPITRKMIRVTLDKEGYRVVDASDEEGALQALAERPDIVLQDLRLHDCDGFELMRRLRAVAGPDLPILAHSAFLPKLEQARALEAGFTDYLFKPVESSLLIETLRAYLPPERSRDRHGTGHRLLLVDDDPVQLKLMKARLAAAGFEVRVARSLEEALEEAREAPPDLIVSDVLMPEMDGFQLCQAVRHDPDLAEVPVLLCSAVYTTAADRELAESAGASALVLKMDFEALQDAIRTALRSGARPSAADPVLLARHHSEALIRQLDRQLSLNLSLSQRLAVREAELGILGTAAESIPVTSDVSAILNDLLKRSLDAAGLSSGAVYLRENDGSLVLGAAFGCPAPAAEGLDDFFGHGELLTRVLEEGDPRVLSAPQGLSPDVEALLLGKAGARSLVLVPLVLGEQWLGVLAMMSADKQLTNEWFPFARSVGVQIAHGVVLARVVSNLHASEEALLESEQRFRTMADSAPVMLWMTDSEGLPSFYNQFCLDFTGRTREEEMARGWVERVHPADLEACLGIYERALQDHTPFSMEYRLRRSDGVFRWVLDTGVPRRSPEGGFAGYTGCSIDITERRLRERDHEVFVQMATALRRANASRDMFAVVLDQVEELLSTNAAAIVMREGDHAETLVELGRGRWVPLTGERGRLAEALAGEVISSGMPYLNNAVETDPKLSGHPAMTGLTATACVPLIAQNRTLGALWVGRRSSILTDELRLLVAIAEITASALHRASSHEQAERARADLVLAYDATLVGWSRALDLRDHETEGHTRRVTAITVRMATALGIPESDIVHVRRGALLHDIGKMGIPDRILCKPGPLDAEEWEIMRRHPVYAYNLLSPIGFLEPALDIPYCHHEKWDGTGYPRGLVATAIPLAARIFALGDVWDALGCDRPYRAAWPRELVVEHMRRGAGAHFDPSLVEMFLADVHADVGAECPEATGAGFRCFPVVSSAPSLPPSGLPSRRT